ncbi:hypothetical protein GCM10010329_55070 [Streptomyces spiroverticillatus]|uniref:DUF742 domain-containing protein n=1 Tax=Streptomyces finlayi TaxID=67296 RepID=A0A919CCC9_9ACTN|nr:hypothetical protein GCM10010329_55070 [Streptomyces spiroverticillatus]GHD05768.1 hypothetical protein GCM10010334_56740 [Streptomyces finlayi]
MQSEEENVATPPNGSSADWPYGRGPGQGQSGQSDPSQNRFNFPSAPSRSPQGGQQSSGYQQPYEQRPYQQQPPQPPRHGQPSGIQPVPPRQQTGRAGSPSSSSSGGGGHNPLVRPYAMTGGRTRPRYQLAIEALVHTTAEPSRLQGQLPEHQRICHLCREIKSVAEISALLSIPLGVARILVADLAEAGLVAIHQPGGDEAAGGQPDVTLLERVLSGLRKL